MNAIPPAEIAASNAESMKAALSAMFGDDTGVSGESDGEDSRTFTVTMGSAATQTTWGQRGVFAWGDLAAMLTSHKPGGKEGSCIVPAVFSGTSRKKEEAAQIDVAFLDSDSGMPLVDIQANVTALGVEAVISSTHSHMTTRTKAKRSHWDKFFAANPEATVADFLRIEKHYVSAVTTGAEPIESGDEDYVLIRHQPCPKFRVAVPLARPWVASDYPSQAAANAAWKERIEALAAALRLDHDQSCTDTSRLFYLPRRPPNGAAAETAIINGTHCDIFELPAAPSPGGLFTASPGKTRKLRQQTDERPEYIDPIQGEIIDLAAWARGFGGRFLIAKALHARKPGAFTGLVADGAKVHIDCPNGEAHTDPGRDNATYIVNAGQSETKGFVVHCRHAHCTGRDRVSFVKQMLEQEWLTPDDLTDPLFLLRAESPPADGDPAGNWTDEGPPHGEEAKRKTASRQDGPRNLQVLTPAEIGEEQARPYVIKGLIAQGDHAIAMGQPGSGKSVLAPHLAYAVAQGREVLGRRVKAGPVVYLAAEDGHGMKNRIRALYLRYGDAPDFHLIPEAVDLMTINQQHTELEEIIQRIRPVLIVVDTIARSFPGLRENEAEDMGRVVRVARDLADICGAAVLNVHHVAKDAGTTPRGHGSLNGDADITLLVEGAGNDTRSLKLGKNRSGPSDITFAFDIVVEELGIDEDGDKITAPVLREAEAQAAIKEAPARLNDQTKVMLREIRNMLDTKAEMVRPLPEMPLVRAVSRKAVRQHLIASGWFPDSVLLSIPGSQPELERRGMPAETKALTTLKSKGFLCFNREWVWLL